MPLAVEAHIPAWRRLGLKLKNAPEQVTTIPGHAPVSPKKRKFQGEEQENVTHGESKPTKKAKDPTVPDDHASSLKTIQDATNPSPTTPKKPTLRKSVSFAAEAKTEDGESAKDLYNTWLTTQQSSNPSFDPSSFNQDALKAVTPTSINIAHRNPKILNSSPTSKDLQPTSTPKQKKKKKKKRNKSKSTTLVNPTSNSNGSNLTKISQSNQPTTHPALTYLTSHQTTPSTWKFSKSRSSYLLRHLFSLTHIPASYSPALESYLSGLQSENALLAIRQRALDLIKEDDEWLNDSSNFTGWSLPLDPPHGNQTAEAQKESTTTTLIAMDDPTKRKEIYLQALKQHAQTLRAREDTKEETEKDRIWQMKIQRRKRVDAVLRILNQHVYGNPNGPVYTPTAAKVTGAVNGVSTPAGTTGTETGNGNGKGTHQIQNSGSKRSVNSAKRKRKRRTTGLPDDDSSSSSSSSSSDSESEPYDDTERMMKRAKRIKMLDAKIEALKAGSESESDSDSDETSSSGSV
ncbi:MAG: hypothetical protein Q9178_001163 [Gyalolechia marmorata]